MGENASMITYERALQIVDETIDDMKTASETIPTRESLGRTLFTEATSCLDLPPFDKSAMDGYAVLVDDVREEYELIETVYAGHVGSKELAPGKTVKVMTGSPVPAGTGRVIMVEHAKERRGMVTILKHDNRGNVCKKAEDVRKGQVILSAGTRIGPVEIANLISCGPTKVTVAKPVQMAILSTGDEIVDSPDLVGPGKIMNSNGPMLASLARTSGIEVLREERVSDEKDKLVAAIRDALEAVDIVVISGGVSVGESDFVLEALNDLGLTVHFSRVTTKPGKPVVYATGHGGIVFGLPGNPVSAYLTFHLYVLRAVAQMTGASRKLREISLPMERAFVRRKAARRQYVPCAISENGTVEPVKFHGSAHLLALAKADGFFVVPAGVTEFPAGERVAFLPLTRIHR